MRSVKCFEPAGERIEVAGRRVSGAGETDVLADGGVGGGGPAPEFAVVAAEVYGLAGADKLDGGEPDRVPGHLVESAGGAAVLVSRW
jgi:hypothetical protein